MDEKDHPELLDTIVLLRRTMVPVGFSKGDKSDDEDMIEHRSDESEPKKPTHVPGDKYLALLHPKQGFKNSYGSKVQTDVDGLEGKRFKMVNRKEARMNKRDKKGKVSTIVSVTYELQGEDGKLLKTEKGTENATLCVFWGPQEEYRPVYLSLHTCLLVLNFNPFF